MCLVEENIYKDINIKTNNFLLLYNKNIRKTCFFLFYLSIYLLYFKKIMYKNYKKKRFFYFPDLFQESNVQKLFKLVFCFSI
jgi:hypothetical protein